mmetsp:Transcript_4688/g.7258  ORF Transcript_4688/g.7258 Transcript_4688/m.7258 type:complete len:200 (+) Transcript_4688:435-1034(+)
MVWSGTQIRYPLPLSEVRFLGILVLLSLLFLIVTILFLVLFLSFLFLLGYLYLLERRIWVNSQLLRHKPIHPVDKCRWVCNLVTGLDERRLEKNLGRVHGSLVLLVGLHLGKEVSHDGMIGVDLQGLPTRHHRELVLVLEGLRLHDPLLLGGVSKLRGHNNHGRVGEPLGDLDLLHLDARILHGPLLSQVRELLLPPVR